jgi:hypothetical protein
MEYLTIPTFQTLRGEEAIKSLTEYIKELEEQKPMELTEKQTNALIKSAKGLIASIESETSKASMKNIKQGHCVSFKNFKDAVLLRLF